VQRYISHMTQEGEELTQKGGISDQIFSIKRKIALGFPAQTSVKEPYTIEPYASFGKNLKMIFVLKGILKGFVKQPKRKTFILSEDQHNLVLTGEDTTWEVASQDHDIICLEIDFSFLAQYLPSDHQGLVTLNKGIEKKEAVLFSAKNLHISPEIISILNSLKTSTHSGFCERLFLESKVLELLMFQLSQFEQINAAKAPKPLKEEELCKMQEVKSILLDNINTQIPLRTLAHMVGTNEFNLKRNFKIAFGNTVYGYLNNYKMELAKNMLIEKDFTISEIAAKIGYKYATHFSSAFKKYFGYLPNKLKAGKLSLIMFTNEFSMLTETFFLTTG
jgi:AraC-like DNA-binding protein